MDRFRKGLSPDEKEQWVAVANHTRLDCLDDGNSETFCDALAVRAANAAMTEAWIEIAVEGGPGSGNWGHAGIPGNVGGSAARSGPVIAQATPSEKVRKARTAFNNIWVSPHAKKRTAERRKYQSVKAAVDRLRRMETPPGEWHMTLTRRGKLDGYLVGVDGVVKSVLGAWYKKANLKGPDLAEMAEVWLELAWQPLT